MINLNIANGLDCKISFSGESSNEMQFDYLFVKVILVLDGLGWTLDGLDGLDRPDGWTAKSIFLKNPHTKCSLMTFF